MRRKKFPAGRKEVWEKGIAAGTSGNQKSISQPGVCLVITHATLLPGIGSAGLCQEYQPCLVFCRCVGRYDTNLQFSRVVESVESSARSRGDSSVSSFVIIILSIVPNPPVNTYISALYEVRSI
ncbi:hypothetical protein ElyMa_005738100 [Elysia marginata]|uniref:Uncharacterized protein n=1 Tax=Elysia marginata TaxID=1093978 RepID=A0AAV4FM48_9GAST|nr:hypothetical protein ElyMa_005738100 [Elysia marginata]